MSITDIIAFLGLALGLANLWLYLRERIPVLRVLPSVEKKLLPIVGADTSPLAPVLSIRLVNPTDKPIAIKSVFVQPDGGNRIGVQPFHGLGSPTPPPVVEPRRDFYFIVRGEDLINSLQASTNSPRIRVQVIVQDKLDREYKSKRLVIIIEQLKEKALPQTQV